MWNRGRSVALARAPSPVPPRRAISEPPPGDGEVRRTALEDTFDGIRFEIGRMAKYVQAARSDEVVIDAARLAAAHWGRMVEEMSARNGNPVHSHNSKVLQLEGIDIWCRAHFCYLNDGANVEVIQTPRRMVKTTRMGREVLEAFLDPFYRALESAHPEFAQGGYEPPPIFTGDCDEASVMVCSMAAALDITPVAFRFGGGDGTLHHVWARVRADGEWYDSDVTEPSYRLGDVGEFEHYEEYEIPL